MVHEARKRYGIGRFQKNNNNRNEEKKENDMMKEEEEEERSEVEWLAIELYFLERGQGLVTTTAWIQQRMEAILMHEAQQQQQQDDEGEENGWLASECLLEGTNVWIQNGLVEHLICLVTELTQQNFDLAQKL